MLQNIAYVVSAFRRTVTVRLKPDTTYGIAASAFSNRIVETVQDVVLAPLTVLAHG